MADLQRAREVKRIARARLLGLPGVHTVAVGAKLVDGQPTEEPAIMVYVVRKRPLSEVPPNELIPPEIDGVKTDVIEAGRPRNKVEEDEDEYRPLKGGIQVQVGAGGTGSGRGTLGCFASFPADGRVVALTCWHVVVEPEPRRTTLNMDHNIVAGRHTFEFRNVDSNGVDVDIAPVNTGVSIAFSVFPNASDPSELVTIYIQSASGDRAAQMAQKLNAEISGLADPRFQSTLAGTVVTIVPSAGVVITVDDPADLFVFGPPTLDPEANLRASVAGKTITLTGSVTGDFYGLFTSFNASGQAASRGVFTRATKNQSLSAVATRLAADLNKLGAGTATASGKTVTLSSSSIDFVECAVWSDIRVGQDSNGFGSKCSECCSDRVGEVIDARFNIDVALIQADPGLEYNGTIAEIGFITGTHNVTDAEALAHLPVQKRGRTTRLTSGTVEAIDADGILGEPPRQFRDALLIRAPSTGPFSLGGDSGSAIVRVQGQSREIVGFLFGGSDTIDYATRIQEVLDTFPIQITTETAQTANTPRVVPPLAAGVAARLGVRPPPIPLAPMRERIGEVERELADTGTGKRFIELVRRHMSEARRLVDQNRRVGAAWQRHGGPMLVRAVLQSLQAADKPLPTEIGDLTLEACLEEIAKAFRAHASADFVSELDGFRHAIASLGGKTYHEVVLSLRRADTSAALPTDRGLCSEALQ